MGSASAAAGFQSPHVFTRSLLPQSGDGLLMSRPSHAPWQRLLQLHVQSHWMQRWAGPSWGLAYQQRSNFERREPVSTFLIWGNLLDRLWCSCRCAARAGEPRVAVPPAATALAPAGQDVLATAPMRPPYMPPHRAVLLLLRDESCSSLACRVAQSPANFPASPMMK